MKFTPHEYQRYAMANGVVKAKTGDDTTDTVYQNWYQSVYLPTDAVPANG